ncbi:deoxynucleoside triphosphate triphosphohydrolase SAMHD1-like [Xenia sp. Carnegie-2017]|uniref:deoxynucleoside triphosphate triphosphohydrolase SAMHD1-like n=1 Tax=Xenia sp. Carnegie-2017 TaxID=2897299 RepID=UPI001F0408E5|nr:deoxynucleoside triphosphate triphosphohydrolase SAMHD1-like [Xenia sp. Carnegie-2017]
MVFPANVEGDSASNQTKIEYKIFNDPIHGTIELHPLLVDIINTPQFQRLKDIKQMGICHFIYPGATHDRFQHSLGTSHLCGELIDRLKELHRKEYEITDEESLCIKIAGLCHDLGHGPFSHFFDDVYKKKLKSDVIDLEWKHEDLSCELFKFMLEEEENPELRKRFRHFDLFEKDEEFILELIKGKDPIRGKVERKCQLTKLPKWFLYEIVSNKQNGVDCDKFDYFARDCANVGVKSTFDHQRYFKNVRIMSIDEELHICVRDKEVFNLYELFHTRWSIHHKVCCHKTQAPIHDMLATAFQKVDKIMKISEAVKKKDMKRYTVLTDSILYDVLRKESEEPAVKEAQDWIKRIQKRKIYKFCGQTQPQSNDDCPSEEKIVKDLVIISDEQLNEEDIFVDMPKIDFGMKGKNPVDAVTFFIKSGENVEIKREQVSRMLPQNFQERYIRVYAKHPENKEQTELIKKTFRKWCSKQKYPKPIGG